MSVVDELQAAIDNLTEQRTASLMMPDFYEGLSTIAEWRASCVLIVTLHRTIDAQLAILAAGRTASTAFPAVKDDTDLPGWAAEAKALALPLARAINGGTK